MIQANSSSSEKVCDHPSTEKADLSEAADIIDTFRIIAESQLIQDGHATTATPTSPLGRARAFLHKHSDLGERAGQVIAHPANLHGSEPESSEPSLLGRETVREALEDLQTHYAAWRDAIASKCTPFGSDDDGSYWDHELKAFDRTFRSLSPLKE